MRLQEITNKVAKELNLPEALVSKTYRAYWGFIRDSIQSLPLKEDLTEEGFFKLKTCFNIPSLGKLSCTYDRMKAMKKRFEYIKNIKNERNKN